MGTRHVLLIASLAGLVVVGIALATARPDRQPFRPGPSVSAGAYHRGNCTTTTAALTWGSYAMQYERRISIPPQPMLVSGRLAAPPTNNLVVGAYWYVAAPVRSEIALRATRIDRDAPPIDFSAVGYEINHVGYPSGDADPERWPSNWQYRTSVDFVNVFPTAAGCWKVAWVGGTETDVIVVDLWGVLPPR